MPQLDKYIFSSQILILTFFFFLIYIYIRGKVVPKISAIQRYRILKVDDIHIDLDHFALIKRNAFKFYEKKAVRFTIKALNSLNTISSLYKKNSTNQINNLNKSLNAKIYNKTLSTLIIKNKVELKRLTTVLNK